ncbi:FISUMP domain-containing protein [Maribellus comscasis]|uniref:FISUMP domain-containing protein n=1 Tax=Maribellus comscasis TaxID=2681766 RepID=UPI00131DFDAF|nr:FISUMP domain-containing protein [Maribellus comscasis]
MKRIFTFLAALLVTASAFSQSPQGMSYQAVIRNSNDELVTNQSIGMQISVLQGSADGTTVYTETQTSTTNTNGLVSIEIGNGTLVSGDFAGINWANGPYFIKTEADPEGGTAYTITGISQLMSVPYALYSKTAETVTGGISETDPDFNASIAAAITEEDTARWNNMANDTSKIQDINLSGTDLSITYGATVDLSVLQDGTGTDSQVLTLYNNKYLYISNGNSITLPYLIKEADGDPENELQSISINGNTVSISNGGSIELPAETDPFYSAWDKSSGISITESQITDLTHFTNDDESDPLFSNSEAANITAVDISNLSNLSGTNTGDQDLSSLATKSALADSSAQIRSEIPDVSGFLTSETDPSVPTGTQAGDMQYWNGSAWITVAAGNEGQVLTFTGGVPTWTWTTQPKEGEVQNPTTGEIWMDKNLGATQVATSSTDAAAFGDLYQWGRAADGHQSRTSGTTHTLATSDTPGHGEFILSSASPPYDWRNPQNNNLWQGVSGTNNPCPSGYRLPTEAEWKAERASWSSNTPAGAFASPLKLSKAGIRSTATGNEGYLGSYWSSTVNGTDAGYLYFATDISGFGFFRRSYGCSVRCLKD